MRVCRAVRRKVIRWGRSSQSQRATTSPTLMSTCSGRTTITPASGAMTTSFTPRPCARSDSHSFLQTPLAHGVHLTLWKVFWCSFCAVTSSFFLNVLSRFQIFLAVASMICGFFFNCLNTGAWGALPVKGHYGATEDEPGFLWVRLGYHQKMHLCCLLSPGCQAQGTSYFTLNMLDPVATGCGRFIAA